MASAGARAYQGSQ